MLDVSCESSARQRIHMEYQVLFLLKNNENYSSLSSAVVVIGALTVNTESSPSTPTCFGSCMKSDFARINPV